jgi:error-prone DNA polymerase
MGGNGDDARDVHPHDREAPPSTWGLDGPAVRLGMRMIKGMRQDDAEHIEAERKRGGDYTSLDNLLRRTGVKVAVLRSLARADAFTSMGLTRQAALWHVQHLRDEVLPLFDGPCESDQATQRQSDAATATARSHAHAEAGDGSGDNHRSDEAKHAASLRRSATPPLAYEDLSLPDIPRPRQILEDYERIGLSLKGHPVQVVRPKLDRSGVRRAADLVDQAACPSGAWVEVAGVVLVRQRPGTASGIVFMTIEDETGIANLIIRPKVFETYRQPARHAAVVLARGRIEREGKVVHVQTFSLRDITAEALSPATRSRDFH